MAGDYRSITRLVMTAQTKPYAPSDTTSTSTAPTSPITRDCPSQNQAAINSAFFEGGNGGGAFIDFLIQNKDSGKNSKLILKSINKALPAPVGFTPICVECVKLSRNPDLKLAKITIPVS